MVKPWKKWWVRDWMQDTRSLSVPARALLADLYCLGHLGEPYGHVTRNGLPVDEEELAKTCRVKLTVIQEALEELFEQKHVRKDEVTRALMVEKLCDEERARLESVAQGRRGGNPRLKGGDKGGDNPPVKGGVKQEEKRIGGEEDRRDEPPTPLQGEVGGNGKVHRIWTELASEPELRGLTLDQVAAVLRDWSGTGGPLEDMTAPTEAALVSAVKKDVVFAGTSIAKPGWFLKSAVERFVKKEAGGKETEKQSEPDWYCGG